MADEGYRFLVSHPGVYEADTASGAMLRWASPALPASRELGGPWQLRFPPDWGAPESTELDRLISWTQHSQEGIKYFSGTATYETQFDLPGDALGDGLRVYLDLGRVGKVARVTLNGQPLGIAWKPPLVLEATTALQVGANRLSVEVANTWNNRLVGDAALPESQRYCRTNMTQSQTWKLPWKDTPLIESGLLGPVQLVWAREVVMENPSR